MQRLCVWLLQCQLPGRRVNGDLCLPQALGANALANQAHAHSHTHARPHHTLISFSAVHCGCPIVCASEQRLMPGQHENMWQICCISHGMTGLLEALSQAS